MKRRGFLGRLCTAILGSPLARAAQIPWDEKPSSQPVQSNPWSERESIQPQELARLLSPSNGDQRPAVISVVFPALYRQRHIPGAVLAGPGSKSEGLEQLKSEAAKLPKDETVVIYCGCCPMDRCPNIRPAYRTLRAAGFVHVRVLNLPTNFHNDWVAKGYPVEPAVATAGI